MTDSSKTYASKAMFIFGEPPHFFEAFASIEQIETPIKSAILAFKENLCSALRVGSIPFQLVYSAILDQRFSQLQIAEKIRARKHINAGEELSEEAEKNASRIAAARMQEEFKTNESTKLFSEHTLAVLDSHISRAEFQESADELLRQVLVMAWGAFEILINDSFRLLLNERPCLVACFLESKQHKDALLAKNRLFNELKAHNFDLSEVMGDIFCDELKLDSLVKIREAVSLMFADEHLDTAMKDSKLWQIAQQRHLIVHRRGIIDASYLARTSDKAEIGSRITFDANYVEGSIALIRDVGLVFLNAGIAILGEADGSATGE